MVFPKPQDQQPRPSEGIANGVRRYFDDNITLSVGGIPAKHIRAFLELCSTKDCCILIRDPGIRLDTVMRPFPRPFPASGSPRRSRGTAARAC